MEENDCPFQAWQPSPDMFDDDESTPEAEVTDISKEDSLDCRKKPGTIQIG